MLNIVETQELWWVSYSEFSRKLEQSLDLNQQKSDQS